MALRGPGHGERSSHAELLALVVEPWTLSGSAKRPLVLSTISASSSQVSQWPIVTSRNSSARS